MGSLGTDFPPYPEQRSAGTPRDKKVLAERGRVRLACASGSLETELSGLTELLERAVSWSGLHPGRSLKWQCEGQECPGIVMRVLSVYRISLRAHSTQDLQQAPTTTSKTVS